MRSPARTDAPSARDIELTDGSHSEQVIGSNEQSAKRCGQEESAESLLGHVTDEFIDRLNRGEQPSVKEYTARYPQIAALLGQVLPTLLAMREPGEPDAPAPGKSAAVESAAPLALGDYRLLREIGRGGMGVVYEAEQLSLRRRVALKVLPFAAVLDGKQLQRFKNEAHAAAQLHHQNIVPVYYVGNERGVHFYAMQFIEGQTLADVISDLKRLQRMDSGASDTPGIETNSGAAAAVVQDSRVAHQLISPSSMSSKVPNDRDGLTVAFQSSAGELDAPSAGSAALPRARLLIANDPGTAGTPDRRTGGRTTTTVAAAISTERSAQSPTFFSNVARLGVQVAEALEHAHSLGVIHRDIKPANLLLDVRGNVWITDFGLAQFQTDSGLTMSGDLVGTIRYMSPEQALAKRVNLDHRTDIYSLGVTLYEMLTLQSAFQGEDRQELLRQIAFEEPSPPRRINQRLPVELETVVLKAMAKNPAERYSTAQELADDLARYLHDEPIRARRPTLLQTMRRWSRRHRQLVWAMTAFAAVLIVVVVAGLTVGTVLLAQANGRIQNERNEVTRQRDEAKWQRDLADRNFQMARQAVATYLTQVSEDQLLEQPGMQPLRERLLRSALEYYQTFVQKHRDDSKLQRELADAYWRVASITVDIGSRADARLPLEQAITILTPLHQSDGDDREVEYSLARWLGDVGPCDRCC